MRIPNTSISFCACSTDISGVFIRPPFMYCRRDSSSSSAFLGLMIEQTIFSIWGMNPIRSAVLITLNAVWNIASANDSLAVLCVEAVVSRPTREQTILTKGKKTTRTHMTPNTLKSRWARAALRAWVLADMAAMLAVTVVPMFSPITRAIPWKIVIAPVVHRTMVIAISAADDCAMQVRTDPIRRKRRIVQ